MESVFIKNGGTKILGYLQPKLLVAFTNSSRANLSNCIASSPFAFATAAPAYMMDKFFSVSAIRFRSCRIMADSSAASAEGPADVKGIGGTCKHAQLQSHVQGKHDSSRHNFYRERKQQFRQRHFSFKAKGRHSRMVHYKTTKMKHKKYSITKETNSKGGGLS